MYKGLLLAQGCFGKAWIFVDAGKKGTEKQCIGLAKALGYSPYILPVSFPRLIKWLPARVLAWIAFFLSNKRPEGHPDYILSGGRQGAAMAAAVRKKLGSVPAIHLLNPYGLDEKFDWVIRPWHDKGSGGPNTLRMLGALHDLTEEKLHQACKVWKPVMASLPRPYTVVLIGGPNKTHRFTQAELRGLLQQLENLTQGSLLVSVSRRTPGSFLPFIQEALKKSPHFLWYEGCGQPNPYEGFLALADCFILTSDSVSMVMEAAFTGKPLHLFYLPTHSKKFKRFYHQLNQHGILAKEGGYTPVDEKERIAQTLNNE